MPSLDGGDTGGTPSLGGGAGGGSGASGISGGSGASGTGAGGGTATPSTDASGGTTTPGATPSLGTTASGSFNAGPNQAIGQWTPDIDKAASLTGIDPNLMWGGLKAYVGVGNEGQYANNVLTNANVLKNGGKLDDSQ